MRKITRTAALALSLLAASAAAGAAETVTYKGTGTYTVTRALLPLANGGAALLLSIATVAAIEPSESGFMEGDCAGLSYADAQGSSTLKATCTFDVTTFEENPVEDLPPPPEEQTTDLSSAPTFTPFTVAPSILNRSEVIRAMEREYPPLLRDAGIGGTVRVYFFIDEEGSVQDFRIDQSSGHQALDDAALSVAGVYRFSAALNRDKVVPVWVSFPITFQVR